MGLPTVTITGNVKFKETKVLSSGKQVTSLVVSCSDKRKDGNYDNLNIKAEFWEQSAKFVDQYFQDGSPISVTGKLVTNTYESNGQKRSEIKFMFPQASFIPKDQSQGQPQQPQQAPQQQQAPQSQPTQQPSQQGTPPSVDPDSIPFNKHDSRLGC